jgi:hypothetical protein
VTEWPIIFFGKNEKSTNYFESGDSEKWSSMKINSLRNGEIIRFQFKPKGNPYVGQDQIGANKFIINKVKY